MNIIKPYKGAIILELSIADTLLILDGLKHISEDAERLNIDRHIANNLIDSIKAKANYCGIDLERGD